jgi:hypothetical protein
LPVGSYHFELSSPLFTFAGTVASARHPWCALALLKRWAQMQRCCISMRWRQAWRRQMLG